MVESVSSAPAKESSPPREEDHFVRLETGTCRIEFEDSVSTGLRVCLHELEREVVLGEEMRDLGQRVANRRVRPAIERLHRDSDVKAPPPACAHRRPRRAAALKAAVGEEDCAGNFHKIFDHGIDRGKRGSGDSLSGEPEGLTRSDIAQDAVAKAVEVEDLRVSHRYPTGAATRR